MNITEERIAELKQLVKEELDSYFDLFHERSMKFLLNHDKISIQELNWMHKNFSLEIKVDRNGYRVNKNGKLELLDGDTLIGSQG